MKFAFNKSLAYYTCHLKPLFTNILIKLSFLAFPYLISSIRDKGCFNEEKSQMDYTQEGKSIC